MNHLLCFLQTNWYRMRWSSQHGLQHAFDRFYAACDQAGTKISTKTIEVLCLSILAKCDAQSSVFCKRAENSLQQVETLKYLRVAVTSDGSRNKEIDTNGLVKQTQFCASFIAPWLRNGFQRSQNFHFVHRSLFRSSPVARAGFNWCEALG